MTQYEELDLFAPPPATVQVVAEEEPGLPPAPENPTVNTVVFPEAGRQALGYLPIDPTPTTRPPSAEQNGAQGDHGVAEIDAVQHHLFPELAVATSSLEARLVVPPFTVLDTTMAYWQARKRAWLGLGIESELGREGNLAYTTDAMQRYAGAAQFKTGTSVFDPVLCEIVYKWWCPPGGTVLDCFAGGSVRGVVAGMLGRGYFGVDLAAAQVAANAAQWLAIAPDPAVRARVAWAVGDSRYIETLAGNRQFDLLFTCPPYYNLERYSDDPADLSTEATWAEFLEAYAVIIRASLRLLRANRFSIWVVGNLRDQTGHLLDLVGATVYIHEQCGAVLYNDAVLATAFGTLPMRTAAQFPGNRKLGRRHQCVLVFWNGNPANVAEHVQPIEGWQASDLVLE